MSAPDRGPAARVSTGTPGLDRMLEGGLVGRRPYLIVGPSGTGKTTLALQFLIEGIRRGERVLLVTMEEPPNEIRINHRLLGEELLKVEVFDAIPDIMRYERVPFKDIASVRHATPFANVPLEIRRSPELTAVEVTMAALEQMLRSDVQRRTYSRIVIDSLTALQYFCMKGFDTIAGAQAFLRFLSDLRVTTILTVESPLEDVDTPERMLARGEIRLFRWELEGRTVRAIGVEKFRGSSHDVRLHPYRIGPQGLDVNLEVTISRDTRQIIEPTRPVETAPREEVPVPVEEAISPLDPLAEEVRDLVRVGAEVGPLRTEIEAALRAASEGDLALSRGRLSRANALVIGLSDSLAEQMRMPAPADPTIAEAYQRILERSEAARAGMPPTKLPPPKLLEVQLEWVLSLLPEAPLPPSPASSAVSEETPPVPFEATPEPIAPSATPITEPPLSSAVVPTEEIPIPSEPSSPVAEAKPEVPAVVAEVEPEAPARADEEIVAPLEPVESQPPLSQPETPSPPEVSVPEPPGTSDAAEPLPSPRAESTAPASESRPEPEEPEAIRTSPPTPTVTLVAPPIEPTSETPEEIVAPRESPSLSSGAPTGPVEPAEAAPAAAPSVPPSAPRPAAGESPTTPSPPPQADRLPSIEVLPTPAPRPDEGSLRPLRAWAPPALPTASPIPPPSPRRERAGSTFPAPKGRVPPVVEAMPGRRPPPLPRSMGELPSPPERHVPLETVNLPPPRVRTSAVRATPPPKVASVPAAAPAPPAPSIGTPPVLPPTVLPTGPATLPAKRKRKARAPARKKARVVVPSVLPSPLGAAPPTEGGGTPSVASVPTETATPVAPGSTPPKRRPARKRKAPRVVAARPGPAPSADSDGTAGSTPPPLPNPPAPLSEEAPPPEDKT